MRNGGMECREGLDARCDGRVMCDSVGLGYGLKGVSSLVSGSMWWSPNRSHAIHKRLRKNNKNNSITTPSSCLR